MNASPVSSTVRYVHAVLILTMRVCVYGEGESSSLEVPIGIRNFGNPKLSEYRFGILTDNG